MRILLIITCVASFAANEAWAQVAAMPGMARPGAGPTNMRTGESAANFGAQRAMRGPASGLGRSYGNYSGQNNNAALGRNMAAAPVPASMLGQTFAHLNQSTLSHGSMFQGSGQRTMFQGSGVQKNNPAAQSQYRGPQNGQAFTYSGSATFGLGNVNMQTAQSPQTPATIQSPQTPQASATRQTAQSAQTPAASNIPSSPTFNGWQRGVLGNGVYGSSVYGGGYPLNNGVQVRTY